MDICVVSVPTQASPVEESKTVQSWEDHREDQRTDGSRRKEAAWDPPSPKWTGAEEGLPDLRPAPPTPAAGHTQGVCSKSKHLLWSCLLHHLSGDGGCSAHCAQCWKEGRLSELVLEDGKKALHRAHWRPGHHCTHPRGFCVLKHCPPTATRAQPGPRPHGSQWDGCDLGPVAGGSDRAYPPLQTPNARGTSCWPLDIMTGLVLTFASAPAASPEPGAMGHPSDSASEAPRDTKQRGTPQNDGVTAEQGCHLCGQNPVTWNFPASLDGVSWAFQSSCFLS